MNTYEISTLAYFIIGIVLTLYWFYRDYNRAYKKGAVNGTVEDGMVSILLLYMVAFWPFGLIMNLVTRKKI